MNLQKKFNRTVFSPRMNVYKLGGTVQSPNKGDPIMDLVFGVGQNQETWQVSFIGFPVSLHNLNFKGGAWVAGGPWPHVPLSPVTASWVKHTMRHGSDLTPIFFCSKRSSEYIATELTNHRNWLSTRCF